MAFTTSTGNISRKIHSYTYGVFNRTNHKITATLDVTKSKNMLFNVKKPSVTKVIEPKSLELMLHSQCLKEEEEYVRSAVLNWV